ncbi:flagellar hook-associated protein FlgK [Polycladidibacter hongkongensis]|uniref:flagellar hook-associated protein FlgK n=1 Tax=Polycladidibacter hongkongensis TaxID=1647556 RepID=UPI00082BD3B5|nr:flagellar hook-associated protein FlgK [Pseudovibrio hongkongensis]
MSLTSAMMTAQSSIRARSAEVAITSQNIANVKNATYHRQTANLHTVVTDGGMGILVSNAKRAANQAALTSVMQSKATATATGSYGTLLGQIDQLIGNPFGGGISREVGVLQGAMRAYSNEPSNMVLAQSVLNGASTLATSLNNASIGVQKVRQDADQSMALSVENINNILKDLKKVNDEVVKGTAAREDVNSEMDKRDHLLQKLSEEIGIDVIYRDNNDVAVYTDSGVTLFETSPRDVTFAAKGVFDATVSGNQVFVDGVSVAGEGARDPLKGGALAGYAKMRDQTAETLQTQLDELSFALIDTFKEVDPTAVGAPAAGLLTWDGAALPTVAEKAGLSAKIRLNANFDPAQGGNLTAVRDGHTYSFNTLSVEGFSEHLNKQVEAMTVGRTFDAKAGVNTNSDLREFTSNAASWISTERQRATEVAALDAAAYKKANGTLSGATGVSLDTQMQLLLNIENAYSASARLMTTVDGMFKTLLQAAR